MSAYLMGRVFYTELPLQLKMTLLALADVAEDDGTKVMLGQARLARKVGCSDRTIRRHLDELRHLGFVEKVGRVGSRGQDRQRIVVEALPTHEQIALMFPRPAAGDRPDDVADRPPSVSRPDTDSTSTGHLVSDDSSVVTHQLPQNHGSPSADYFEKGKWEHLLEKLHAHGWTKTGSGALTWAFLMKLRGKYSAAVVDGALSDASLDEKAPSFSSAAYFEGICVRIAAERAA